MPSSAILLVRFGALGDVILATPLVRAVKAAQPEARLVFVTKARYAPLLARNPYLNEVVALEPDGSLRELARRLRRTPWSERLDLHGSLRSRALRVLVGGAWRSVPRQRIRRALLCRWGIDTFRIPVHAAERYFAAARALEAVPDGRPPEVVPCAADEARAAGVGLTAPYAVLAPGAAHATKRWPSQYWRALAGRLAATGLQVVATGTAAERPLLAAPGVVDAFGLPLGATAALLRGARVVVANDSGLMHLATAVGAPVVALFGPTARQLGCFPYRARGVVLERALPCRPCSPYGSAYCPRGDHRCMIEIVPDEVAATIATGVP